MGQVKQEFSPNSKSHPVRQTESQIPEPLAEPSIPSPQASPIGQMLNRISNTPFASTHAAILNRAPASQQSSNRQMLLQLQRQYGNSYVQQVVQRARQTERPKIHTKLTLGAVGDKYEQEADLVAKQVVGRISSASVEPIQRMEAEDEELAQMKPDIQRQATSDKTTVEPSIEDAIQQTRGSGQPLAESVRVPMEQAFGADFSGVKVHADARSDQLNRSIQAKAFTTGQDMFFRQGEYSPSSRSGQELIAHELTHVVQQQGNRVVSEEKQPVGEQRGREVQTDRTKANLLQRKAKALRGKVNGSDVEVQDRIEITAVNQTGGSQPVLGNNLLPPSLPQIPADERFGYVANVPATPSVDVSKLADDYKSGFRVPAEIPFRFRLVVGINSYESLSQPNQARGEVQQSLTRARTNVGYPYYAFGYTWHPIFAGKTETDVKNAKAGFVPLKFKGQPSDYLAAVDSVVTARENFPYGKFRDMVTRNSQTKEYVRQLATQENFPIPVGHIYIHTGDPDAEHFTVVDGGNAPSGGTPLFDKYQQLLSHRVSKDRQALNPQKYQNYAPNYRKPAPDLISGGYSLEKGRSAGVGPGDELTEVAAAIDMSVRRVMAKQNPLIPYYPEPNTLVRWQSLLQNPNDLQSPYKYELFGTWGSEGDKLKKGLLTNWQSMGGTDKTKATFKPEASIPTGAAGGGERLKARSLLLTTQQLNIIRSQQTIPPSIMKQAWKNVLSSGQNHAYPRSWISKVASTYGVNQNEVWQILVDKNQNTFSVSLKRAMEDMLNLIQEYRQDQRPAPNGQQSPLIEQLAENTLKAISFHQTIVEDIIKSL